MKTSIASTLNILNLHRRALLTFYLFFSGLALAIITPSLTWALASLRPVTGDGAISTGGIIEFLVSPGGILWVVVSLNLAALTFLVQQAGITLIAAAPQHQPYRTALRALWGITRSFLPLIKLTLLQVFTHLMIALPFLAATGLAWSWLLNLYDPYLLRIEKPPELWWFIACAAFSGLGILLCNGFLYLRWILAVPCLMLQSFSPAEALHESTRLTRGHKGYASGLLICGLIAILSLPVLVTFAFDQIAAGIFAALQAHKDMLATAVLVLIAAYILMGIAATFLGVSVYGAFVVSLYQKTSGVVSAKRLTVPEHAGLKAWTAELLVVVLALSQAWLVVSALEQREDVSITAHRGSSLKAPENTLSSIEQAIKDGSDYIEIDVQLTADGVPVLWHDADMNRIFGLRKRISDVRYQDMRDLDAGSWFNTDFAKERIATLAQAVETADGRAKLFIELKPDRNTPHLTQTVVELLQRMEAVDGTIVAAADWLTLQEAKRQEPRLKTALIAQFVMGPLWADNYDILALRANRVTPATIARAHRAENELHVWTVNHPEAMSRFIDMGVDNIITDRPEVLADILQERKNLSDTELLATKLHNWLR
ncbi:glycerophosphodiester phosphodiesterase family protein [Marinobacter sp.]|uniref:glycerophosphodiester phosphodiesterase family protein n=1 Tax=Marinobacter sp. TaxID=50741 RepID=UPI003A8F0A89